MPGEAIRRVALLMPDEYVAAYDYLSPFWLTQKPRGKSEVVYSINPTSGCFDGVVVFQSVRALDRDYELTFPKGRSVLLVFEPPDILCLPRSYSRQFGLSVGADWRWCASKCAYGAPGHNWFVEVPVDDFRDVGRWVKPALLSAVISNKSDTPLHRSRVALMSGLKEIFGDDLDWFGRGVKDIGKMKLSGLQNYRYHIVVENGCWRDYWTEKLADAFVANCYPFYIGAPNIFDYFPRDCLTPLTSFDPEIVANQIRNALSSDMWFRSQTALEEARDLIGGKYNRFSLIVQYLEQIPIDCCVPQRIRPHSKFGFSTCDRVRNRAWDLFGERYVRACL